MDWGDAVELKVAQTKHNFLKCELLDLVFYNNLKDNSFYKRSVAEIKTVKDIVYILRVNIGFKLWPLFEI